MIKNDTVFVLGAGASWHYGYPTGEGLVDGVISMASRFSVYCQRRLASHQIVQLIPEYVVERIDKSKGTAGATRGWERVMEECLLLVNRLQTVRPLLIDHFLAWNESLRPIGKLMIAAVILECEAAKVHRQEWYRFIVHKLVYGCGKSADLFKNKVHFITFNYDASLEYHLFKALTSVDILEQADVQKFLTEDRIVHTYGCVHPGIPSEADFVEFAVARELASGSPDLAREFEPRKLFLDRCLSAAENLRTIDPHDKSEDEETLALANQWIDDAAVIYILGYGFDASNNERIGLRPTLKKGSDKVVMFTNFRDLNTINKKASRLCFGDLSQFTDRKPWGNPAGRYFEKSVRNVYDAFEKDFDALEGELTAATKI
jgi:hypothetical protein